MMEGKEGRRRWNGWVGNECGCGCDCCMAEEGGIEFEDKVGKTVEGKRKEFFEKADKLEMTLMETVVLYEHWLTIRQTGAAAATAPSAGGEGEALHGAVKKLKTEETT